MSIDFQTHSVKDSSLFTKPLDTIRWNGSDGKYFSAIYDNNQVKIAQLESNGRTQNVHTINAANTLDYSSWNPAQPTSLCICGRDKNVDVWDVRASKARAKLPTSGSNLSCSWSRCGNLIAVGNNSDSLMLFDVRSTKLLKKRKFSYQLNDIAFSANSDYLIATVGMEGFGAVEIIDVATEDEILPEVEKVAGHSYTCQHLSIDPGYTRLATGSLDCTICSWDLMNLVCKHTLSMESVVKELSFSGDGQYLAAISTQSAMDYYMLLLDSDSGEAKGKINSRHKISSCAWHPKQNLIAMGIEDRSPAKLHLQYVTFSTN